MARERIAAGPDDERREQILEDALSWLGGALERTTDRSVAARW